MTDAPKADLQAQHSEDEKADPRLDGSSPSGRSGLPQGKSDGLSAQARQALGDLAVKYFAESPERFQRAHALAIEAYRQGAREAQQEPKPEWRCFHCDEVFTDEAEAMKHFGTRRFTDTAVCQLTDEEVKELRGLEQANEKLRIENEELDHEASCYHVQTSELERYFGKGVRSPHQAWLKLEAQEGATEAAYERGKAEGAREAIARCIELTKQTIGLGPDSDTIDAAYVDGYGQAGIDIVFALQSSTPDYTLAGSLAPTPEGQEPKFPVVK